MLKVKVCGMREPQNIEEAAALGPDFMGFIFHEQSPRFVGLKLNTAQLRHFDSRIKKVGVFVDHELEYIVDKKDAYFLDAVQLHGGETPEFCRQLQQRVPGLMIIKAFGVDPSFDFAQTDAYEPYAALFLFDAKTERHGGAGEPFDWSLLRGYRGRTEFLVGGGVGPEHIGTLRRLAGEYKPFIGVDLNSRVEVRPGLKSISRLKSAIAAAREKEPRPA